MGIRLTGLTTPYGGLSWEFVSKVNFGANRKITVFLIINSGNKKAKSAAKKLKKGIEQTKLAEVDIIGDPDGLTVPTVEQIDLDLEHADLCIFLVDNAERITLEMQTAADHIKKHHVMSVFFFCDSKSKAVTALEQSIVGLSFIRCRTIQSFRRLGKSGASALVQDIITIYRMYCRGSISSLVDNNVEIVQGTDNIESNFSNTTAIAKETLQSVSKCTYYILRQMSALPFREDRKQVPINELDEWGVQFLRVLFEAKPVTEFNTDLFLASLENRQEPTFHEIVCLRWRAIQEHFLGHIEKSAEYLNLALNKARETNQPQWVIYDILFDIRHQQLNINSFNNIIAMPDAQNEIATIGESVYYPVLDRIDTALKGEIIEGIFTEKTTPPFTYVLGNNLSGFGKLLASEYIISIYNGSLLNILRLYNRIKDCLFCFSTQFDEWEFKRDMLKFTIISGAHKDTERITDAYPEILNRLDAADAKMILDFCNNEPLHYRRMIDQFVALGIVGYYLDDEPFSHWSGKMISEIKEWFNSSRYLREIGAAVIRCLSGISIRLSQNTLAEICDLFIDHNYQVFYLDLFRFISDNIRIDQMDREIAECFINHLIIVLESDEGETIVNNSRNCVARLRQQSEELTKELDRVVAERFPDYYAEDYMLITSMDEENDFPRFLRKKQIAIQNSNTMQGKGGCFFEGPNDIARVRYILASKEVSYDAELMDSIIAAVMDTLLISKESIATKLDAISLLICILVRYPEDYLRNQTKYKDLIEKAATIDEAGFSIMATNVDRVVLDIGFQILCILMGCDNGKNLVQYLANTQSSVETAITATRFISECYELKDDFLLPAEIETVLLQSSLQWIQSKNTGLRINTTEIILYMLRSGRNESLLNVQLIKLVDSDNSYIKNYIMRNLFSVPGITEDTKNYIVSKCCSDVNYVVRTACFDELKRNKWQTKGE